MVSVASGGSANRDLEDERKAITPNAGRNFKDKHANIPNLGHTSVSKQVNLKEGENNTTKNQYIHTNHILSSWTLLELRIVEAHKNITGKRSFYELVVWLLPLN